MPNGLAPEIPDWYKVGWRDVSGIDRPALQEGEAKDKALLDLFLSEQFYGEWYHNAAMVVVVSISLVLGGESAAYSRVPGRSRNALPYSLPFRHGLGVYHPSILQHILLNLYGPHAPEGA